MSKWILTALMLVGSAYIDASVTLGQQTQPPPVALPPVEEPPVGDSYDGPCFVNTNVECAFALAEWLTIQQPNSTVVQSCDSCDLEAHHIDPQSGQPVYACFTFGKKTVQPSGSINWVKSSDNEGKISSKTIDPPADCGTQIWCKPFCQVVQGLTLQCFEDTDRIDRFTLRARRENGPACQP